MKDMNQKRFRSMTTPTLAVAAATALLLAGCASNGASTAGSDCDTTYTVGVSHPGGDADGPRAIKSILQETAGASCINLLLDNTVHNDLDSQRSTLESWVTQDIDAIVVFPVDASAIANLQESAQAKGIKWITYATKMEGEDGTVGFSAEVAGKVIADDLTTWIAENYPDGGASAAVTTATFLTSLVGRWEKPIAALNAANIPVVSEQDCYDQTCGLQIAEDTLREHPDLRIFIGMNDDAALGARKAFENAGIDPESVYIAGSDGSKEALSAIKEGGPMRVTAALSMRGLAEAILSTSLAALTGEGETDSENDAILVKTGDDKTIDTLLAEYDE
jgi:ABC-type sugar transport system substrate-binding protein